ncbi:prophage PSSB64-02 [Chania multitudinisentens RB-25]|uniref:Prophage PSSB64-02 n=1 Tax=Chania multitudinisentens RB-25 TaxID=1441930 RepID=A0A0D4ZXM1_9GAMM|nr:hypothetical protein [Chania multitudinisentens]AJW28962.1 prophage PSSB64-02 [Chania multitudinisentens RB-25]
MNNKKIILRDSDEAASIKTVTGWVSSTGQFFGDNEDLARFAGATHTKCKNNPNHPIYDIHSYCEACHAEKRQAVFAAMERREWDGDEPLVIFDTDTYFFDIDSLTDYCEENDVNATDLQLVICKPNHPRQIDGIDHFIDDLPEDGELPGDLEAAFDLLNEVIRESGPLSWSQGEITAVITPECLEIRNG